MAETVEPELLISTIRQKGMGGTSVGVGKDDAALFQNPAALTKLGGFHLKFSRLRGEPSTQWFEKQSKISEILEKKGNEGEVSSQTELLKALVPMQVGLNFATSPLLAVSMPGVALGAYIESQSFGDLVDQNSPRLEFRSNTDASAMLGMAEKFTFFNTDVSLGISARYLTRAKVYNKTTGDLIYKLGTADILAHINNKNKQDPSFFMLSGFGVDVGMLAPLFTPIGEASWGVVVKNIGSSLSGQRDREDSNKKTYKENVTATLPVIGAIGISVDTQAVNLPGIFEGTKLAADYKFLSEEKEWLRNFYLGIEQSAFFDVLKLRAGIKQGYVTAGVGLNFWILHLDYAYDVIDFGKLVSEGKKLDYHIFEIGILF